ncbi:MAG TPA: hypothetical protein VFR33_11830 [Candidatus Dormibacteraeota bacterium]|nr:hypothetical protein [Candidatus Dormibacteraeota bacterium]
MRVGLSRIALLIGALLGATLLFSQPVAAQKGAGGLFPAGTYRFSFVDAGVSGFANNVQVFLDASAGTEIARPQGAPETTTSSTQIFLSLFDYNTETFTFDCFTLQNPSDFSTGPRLSGATLNTVLTPSTQSCGFSPPLSSDITISASWNGIGPIGNGTDVSNYSCGSYNAESNGRGLANTAAANLTLTIGDTATTFPASQSTMFSGDFQTAASGSIDPGCGLAGVGSGPSPAGHFRFSGLFANGFFGSFPGPTNDVSLFEGSQTTQATGGPAAGSSEFDLELSFFGGAINGFGCFAIPTTDATSNGVATASLQTTITSATPLCTNSYPGFGLDFPLVVNATWVANGPLIKVHSQDNFQCLGYAESTSTFVQSRGATESATVTMPDYLGNPVTLSLTDGTGSLTQITQTTLANIAIPQACLIRP